MVNTRTLILLLPLLNTSGQAAKQVAQSIEPYNSQILRWSCKLDLVLLALDIERLTGDDWTRQE